MCIRPGNQIKHLALCFATTPCLHKDSHAVRKHLLFTLSNWDTSPLVKAPVPAETAAVQTEHVPLLFPLSYNAKIMKPSYEAQLSTFMFISDALERPVVYCLLNSTQRRTAAAEECARPRCTGLLARLFLCAKIGFSFSQQQ